VRNRGLHRRRIAASKAATHLPSGELIGVAYAAGRVTVGGLDSWLALVEQLPRTDEAPETAGHSQDVPERFARALEKSSEPRGATNAGVWTRVLSPRRSVLRVKSMASSSCCPSESVPAFALSAAPARLGRSPTSPPSRWSAAWSVPNVRGRAHAWLVREASSACAGRVSAHSEGRVLARPSPTSRRGHVNRTFPTNTSTPR
jgi:hypothetical protein